MGMIGRIVGAPGAVTAFGEAAKNMAEVFTPSATKQMELSAAAQAGALAQFGAEFSDPGATGFDRLVNGLNRLPRPMLAFGTLALFGYAMVDPASFGERMVGLDLVPEPLWWLLAAVVGFYFGAREAHYFRARPVVAVPAQSPQPPAGTDGNPALEDWRQVLD